MKKTKLYSKLNKKEVAEQNVYLQGQIKKLKEVTNDSPKNVTKALFVGSTAELQRMLKEK